MTNKAPVISIVTPSYNQAQFLEQTMLSVLQQDYPHIEYIVIDGGSTDGSKEIIEKYADRLAYWCCEKDKGQTDAIAKGFARCTGDIMFWIASDDILLPGALQAVANFFVAHPEEEVLTGGCFFIDANNQPVPGMAQYTLGVPATYDRLRYYEQDGVSQQSTFWRRSAYEAVGGLNRELQFIMDLDLYARLAERRPFAKLPQLLACFRIHEEAKSSTIQHVRLAEQEAFYERHGRNQLPKWRQSLIYWRYRIPSIFRKLWLTFLQRSGAVRFPTL